MAKDQSYLPKRPDQKAPTTHHWKDTAFAKDYPAVFSLLALAFIDGEDRKGATITLFADEGRLKFAIHDRHTEQSLFGTLDGPQDLWQSLEGYVLAHPDDWREKRDAGLQRRKA